MTNRAKKIIFPSLAFVIAISLYTLYFKITEVACGSVPWFQKYIKEEEHFLGISYALSFAFMVFAFLKFKENRKDALKATVGSGAMTVILWFSCFFFGCCGSPMIIVYLNLFGLSMLKFPKRILLIMTVIFISISYLWLIRKSPKGCCNGKPCKEDAK